VGEWMGREQQPFSELVKLFFRRFLENDLICLRRHQAGAG